jgi:hypothetical protein
MDLFQVVHYAEQIPLRIHFLLTPQGKSVQAENGTDMGKRWFADCRPAGKIGYLPDLCLFGFPQATAA